jgi:hypothetical protein
MGLDGSVQEPPPSLPVRGRLALTDNLSPTVTDAMRARRMPLIGARVFLPQRPGALGEGTVLPDFPLRSPSINRGDIVGIHAARPPPVS